VYTQLWKSYQAVWNLWASGFRLEIADLEHNSIGQGSLTFLKLRAAPWIPINTKATSLIHKAYETKKHLLNLPLIYVVIDHIRLCEDTNCVNTIFRAGPWATNTVVASTILVPLHRWTLSNMFSARVWYIRTLKLASNQQFSVASLIA